MGGRRKPGSTVDEVGEFALIERLAARLGPPRHDVVVGIGDDVAVMRTDPGRLLLATCDVQVAGTHFLPERCDPRQAGPQGGGDQHQRHCRRRRHSVPFPCLPGSSRRMRGRLPRGALRRSGRGGAALGRRRGWRQRQPRRHADHRSHPPRRGAAGGVDATGRCAGRRRDHGQRSLGPGGGGTAPGPEPDRSNWTR